LGSRQNRRTERIGQRGEVPLQWQQSPPLSLMTGRGEEENCWKEGGGLLIKKNASGGTYGEKKKNLHGQKKKRQKREQGFWSAEAPPMKK